MCATCQNQVFLPDDRLCPTCVCAQCRARQDRAATYTLPEELEDDPQECTDRTCGWALAMGTAA
ncbi:hypothetical protein [Streptomyces cucumeris]|uniref:hypothetical protein n=1 Tax=Streptomyces cucumeris TaxID=2962890 RepID=UPI003D72FA20